MKTRSAGNAGWMGFRNRAPEQAAFPAGRGRASLSRFLLAALAGACAMAGVPEAPAAQPAAARLTISATVRPWHKVELAGGPSTVQVTEADIQRGYVDLLEPTRLLVRSNARNVYRFEVLVEGGLARAVDLMVRNETYALGAGGGGILLQGTARSPARDDFEVRYRLHLADGVRPGTYAWQPAVSLTVL